MSQLLYSLPLLACPVGMGLMMYFMMRGNKDDTPRPSTQADELTRLRAEVDQLRAAQQHPIRSESATDYEAGERR